MDRHEGPQSGQAPRPRRRKRRLAIALGSAVLLVTGLLQPLGLIGAAHADDQITGPLQDAINRTAKSVQDSLTAATAANTALTANAQAFATQIETILAGAQDDPAGAVSALQGAAMGELGSLESVGLAQALSLASKVAAPSCSTLGALTATLPDINVVPVPYTIFGPLAATVQQLDKGVSDAVQNFYTQAFTTLLTPAGLPANALTPYVTLAQALLTLLKVNWHTTYYPPGGGAPVVRDTPGFLNLPTFIDADQRTGADICGLMGLDLTTGTVNQSVGRLPLSPSTMPLDIQSQFLGGLLTPGYQTKTSKAPATYNTTATLASAGTTFDTSMYKAGTAFDQTLDISTAAQLRLASLKPPTRYHLVTSKPGGTNGNGSLWNYNANARSDKFTYTTSLLGLFNPGVAQTPGATTFEYCTSAKGFCSNESAAASATEGGSMHLLATEPVKLDQIGSSLTSTTCPLLALLPEAHLTGSRMFLGFDSTAKADTPGHVWVDTANTTVNGCLATAGLKGTLPTGFKSAARNAAWQGTGSAPPVTTKTGTITCPDTTSVSAGSFGLNRYFCVFAPANTVAPSITGNAYQGVTLNGVDGTWTPTAPNTPTLARQWQRCATDAASCVNLTGATNSTYTVVAADMGKKLRYTVKGTNPDGNATGLSPLTAGVTLPPAPIIHTIPLITGIGGVDKDLTVDNGVWDNAPSSFTRKWQRCNEDGTGCVDIPGATNATYHTGNADLGHSLQAIVTATNLGGSTSATSLALLIPPAPQSLIVPVIRNGAIDVSGAPVFEGDHLKTVVDATNWKYGQSFTYRWLRCDNTGANCSPISGATASTYTVAHGDVDSTLSVEVTASNPDGSDTKSAPVTGVVLGNALLPVLPNLIPDGPVFAGTPSTNGTYIGGDFDTVGARIGGGGAVPATPTAVDGSKTATLAALVSGGTVNAVVADTTGGYFLGGSFTRAAGAACIAVAHILADGTLDNTYCRPGLTGEVRALNYIKRTSGTPLDALAAGGSFTVAGHQNLVFLDSSGFASYPDAEPNGAVNAMANDGTNFFVGGAFTAMGATAAKRLAAVTFGGTQTVGSALTLTASNYPGGVDCGGGTCSNPEIKAVSLAVNVILVSPFLFPQIIFGGTFDTVYGTGTNTAGVARRNVAAISEVAAGTQLVGNWNPSPDGPITAITGTSGGSAATVYLAGDFTSLSNGALTISGFKGLAEYGITTTTSGSVRTNAASTSGTAATSSPNTPWRLLVDNGQVLSILPADSGVYLAGSFTSISGIVRHRLAHVSAVGSAAPTVNLWDPNAGQTVRSLARYAPSSGTPSMFVGGDYQVLGGTTRNHLAELKKDGTFTTWAPTGTDGPVRALATAGGVLYAGGDFAKSGATARNNLAAFDTTSAALTTWNPGTDGSVHALGVAGSTVYVGGKFANAGGAARSNLAAISTAGTGAATAWNPSVTGSGALVRSLAVDGTTVYIGGEFANAGGAARANLAAISTAGTGAATTWDPGTNASGSVYTLALDPTTVYVGGKFTSAAGVARLNAAGIDRSTGTATAWDPQANDTVRTLALLGTKMFAGGDFTAIGGASRSFAAQLSTGDTGVATEFNPDPNGRVYAITTVPSGLVGLFGSFSTLAGGTVPTNGYAFYGG